MNPMKDALKAKRAHSMGSGMLGADAPVDHGAGPDASGGAMHALVQTLSPDQKQQLMQALSKDSAGDATKIEKGAPSDQERQKISDKMSLDDDQDDGGDGAPDYDSDDIAMSMLDSKDKGPNAALAQPRNLGDRVKQGLASKLKAKGKL